MYELLKTNTAAWFNKICKNSQLTPKYVNIMNIKIKDNNKQNKNTKTAAVRYRLNQNYI